MKIELELEKLTAEEQRQLYLNFLSSKTPFEDYIKLVYQIHYDIEEYKKAGNSTTEFNNFEYENILLLDFAQLNLALANINKFCYLDRSVKIKIAAFAKEVIEGANHLVDLYHNNEN